MESGAVELLCERIGPQLMMLRQEIAKVALLAGPGGPISRAEVDAASSPLLERPIWDLIDAIGEGRSGDALGKLNRMRGAGAPGVVILGSLAAHFSKARALAGWGRRPRAALSHAQAGGPGPALLAASPGGLSGCHPTDRSGTQGSGCALPRAGARAPGDGPIGLSLRAGETGRSGAWRDALRCGWPGGAGSLRGSPHAGWHPPPPETSPPRPLHPPRLPTGSV